MNDEKMIDRCGGSRQQFYFTLKGGIRAVEKSALFLAAGQPGAWI